MFRKIIRLIAMMALILLIMSSLESWQEPDGLSLRTDKKVYKVGEKVTIILENNSDRTIYLRNSAPWRVERRVDNKWIVVFAPIALQVITPLKPKSSKKWLWSQVDNEGKQVPKGYYRVVLMADNKVLETHFEIREEEQSSPYSSFIMYFVPIIIVVLVVIVVYMFLKHRVAL